MGAIGLLRVVSNNEMIAKERSAQVSLDQAAGPMMGLARHLMQRWSAAKRAKVPIETQMLMNMRQRNGLYEAQKLQEIRQMGGSEIFMMLTSSKCRAAQAILGDVALPDSEYPFELKSTPIPSLPGPIEQAVLQAVYKEAETAGWQIDDNELSQRMELLKKMATERLKDLADEIAARMGTRMYDQLTEGGWYTAMREFLYDFTTFKAGIIKGPTLRRRKRLSWGQVGDRWVPVTKEEVVPEFDRRSPFWIYPAPRSRGPQHSYLFDKYEFTREELQRMKGTPGFSSDTIDEALYWYGERGYETPQYRRYELGVLEERPLERLDPEGPLETMNYWGSASGKMLLEWSRDGWRQDINPDDEYQVEAWQLGRYIIKAVINPDPLGRKPYSKASFEEIPGTFWGKGLPEILADVQDQCNGAARAMANNLAISCLTGDTVVYREAQHRSTAAVTLNELWERKHDHNSGLRRSKLRSLDEATGEFFGNRIVDIFDNGIAEVFEVITEKGYRIRATNTHRFMGDDGEWRALSEFDDGELIAVNGQVVPLPRICIECGGPKSYNGVRCKKCASAFHNNSWNQKQVEAARHNRDANATTARARFECKQARKDFCEDCGARAEEQAKLEVHHIDRDPWNNEPENLRSLCEACHKSKHAREDSFGDPFLHLYVSYDRIVSIKYAGKERVFDLAMEGPNHNFIANGFVSHNSGPQVDISIDRLAEGAKITQIFPWKLHQTVGDPSGQNTPAIRFYQPDSHVQELMTVYSFYERIADNVSNIPKYSYGDSGGVGGAGRTASGLSMLMGSADKGFEDLVKRIDTDVTEMRLQHLYEFNMEHDPDPTIKGDLRIQATGVRSLKKRQQMQQRRMEMLQATANPVDMQIMGMDGRRELLRETIKSAELPVDKIIKSQDLLDLDKANLPQPYEMMGKTGPNAPGAPGGGQGEAGPMGMTPGGGTPAAPQTLDQAGAPVAGQDVRQFNQ